MSSSSRFEVKVVAGSAETEKARDENDDDNKSDDVDDAVHDGLPRDAVDVLCFSGWARLLEPSHGEAGLIPELNMRTMGGRRQPRKILSADKAKPLLSVLRRR